MKYAIYVDGIPLLDSMLATTMALQVQNLPLSVDFRQNFQAAAENTMAVRGHDNMV